MKHGMELPHNDFSELDPLGIFIIGISSEDWDASGLFGTVIIGDPSVPGQNVLFYVDYTIVGLSSLRCGIFTDGELYWKPKKSVVTGQYGYYMDVDQAYGEKLYDRGVIPSKKTISEWLSSINDVS